MPLPKIKRPLLFIKTNYIWPFMDRDIRLFFRTCEQCQLLRFIVIPSNLLHQSKFVLQDLNSSHWVTNWRHIHWEIENGYHENSIEIFVWTIWCTYLWGTWCSSTEALDAFTTETSLLPVVSAVRRVLFQEYVNSLSLRGNDI